MRRQRRKQCAAAADPGGWVRQIGAYEGGAFDVVVDKGGLDALMGEEGDDASTAGQRLLHEVQRLVAPGGGRYLCVTLAQSHAYHCTLPRTCSTHIPAPSCSSTPFNVTAAWVSPHPPPRASVVRVSLSSVCRAAAASLPSRHVDGGHPCRAHRPPHLPLAPAPLPCRRHQHCSMLPPFFLLPLALRGTATTSGEDVRAGGEQRHPPRAAGGHLHARGLREPHAIRALHAATTPYACRGWRMLCRLTLHVPGGTAETQGEECGEVVVMAPQPDDGAPSPATDSCGGSAFSGVVLDATPTMLDGASLPCAVFLVPQVSHCALWAALLAFTTCERWEAISVPRSDQARVTRCPVCARPAAWVVAGGAVTAGAAAGARVLHQDPLRHSVRQLLRTCVCALIMHGVCCTAPLRATRYITTETAAVTGTVRAEVASVTTGAMVVLDDVLSPPHCTRRLVFRRNPNLVQSEALLVPAPPPTPAAPQEEQRGSAGGGASDVIAKEGGKKGGAGGKQKQGKAAAAAADLAAGASKKSKKAAAKAARKQQAAEEVGRSGGVEWVVDHGQLASEYHGAMLAGLSLVAPLMEARESTNAQLTAAVIGLGGGALPMFLRQHFPFTSITVAELDDVMGQVASDHFGFTQDAVLRLHIGDGVALVHAMAAPHHTQGVHEGAVGDDTVAAVQCATAALALSGDAESGGGRRGGAGVDVIFVDADSDDPSTGMSCPAQVFLEPHFLQSARAALNEGGMLVLNVVARASSKYKAAVAAVRQVGLLHSPHSPQSPHSPHSPLSPHSSHSPYPTPPSQVTPPPFPYPLSHPPHAPCLQVFPAVYEVDVDGDINRVLFALPATPPALAACADETAAARVLKLGAVRVAALAGRFAPWGKGPSVVKLAGGLKLAA
ncbi:unnamed protein product [Closterium sp. NIES-54]